MGRSRGWRSLRGRLLLRSAGAAFRNRLRDVADEGIAFLASAGIETVASAIPPGTVMSHDQGAMTPDEVFELASAADHDDAEATVLSCTDLRAVEATQRIEAELQKPVVAVNQAMFTELVALEG